MTSTSTSTTTDESGSGGVAHPFDALIREGIEALRAEGAISEATAADLKARYTYHHDDETDGEDDNPYQS